MRGGCREKSYEANQVGGKGRVSGEKWKIIKNSALIPIDVA